MDFDLLKIEDVYYLYASLTDKEPNNYSILIEDVEYFKGAKIIKEDLQRNFTIKNNITDFSISKGFVMTQDDFSITIQNLQEDKINVTSEFLEERTKELYSGEIIELNFDVSNAPAQEIKILKLSSENTEYKLPIFVLEVPKQRTPVKFDFDVPNLNITLDINNGTKRTIYINNTGEETIFQLKLSLSEELEKYASLSQTEFFNLSAGFLYPLELSIFSDEMPRTFNGEITAISGGVNQAINVSVKFSPGHVEEVVSGIGACSELGGTLCASEDLCGGEIFIAEDGNCCPGNCGSPKKPFPWKIFGWLIIILLIIGVVWFYFQRFKKAEPAPKGVFKFLKKQ
jgi:hypothetical protein